MEFTPQATPNRIVGRLPPTPKVVRKRVRRRAEVATAREPKRTTLIGRWPT